MPRLALVLCAFWFVSLFVFRSLLQLRQTGSTGIKGFHGPMGSLPWIAGLSASLGLLAAPLAPLGQLFGLPGGALLISNHTIHLVGAAFVLIGVLGALAAQLSMGNSWRVGVDESESTELVTTGLFAWVRNPIFSFILLSAIGLVLMVPNMLALSACLLTWIGIEAQVRAVEEPYLIRTHGDFYKRYADRVGRFLPNIGRAVGRRRRRHPDF